MFNRPKNFVFNIRELEELGVSLSEEYSDASPFRHVQIENFLPKGVALEALKQFPGVDSNIWLDWRKRNTINQPRKLGIGDASRLQEVSPFIINLLNAFNSYAFLNFLEKLTGIEKLLPDPYFHGGGLHQILDGGKLDIHTDFNFLKKIDLYRRINVLLYLNKDWKSKYNGDLELWDENLKECRSISPSFNKLVVFNTDKKSYHGHPIPLDVPSGVTRKSIALYYYTALPCQHSKYDTKTDWYSTSS